MLARAKVGDVFEIPTSKGLTYAQYVHNNDKWGALIRVLPGFFPKRPGLSQLAKEPERFVTFFPLEAALTKKIFQIVGTEEIPPTSRAFPVFRAAGHVDREGRVHDWLLWNGEREWKIGQLTDASRALPIRSVWNDTLLVQRIEEGWTPATDRRSQP